jgi:glycosyltransferase involved in cell wall biosynthesis
LTDFAGSEKVVEQFLGMWPGADLHVLVDHLPQQRRGWLDGRTIRTSPLQSLPLGRRWFRALLPFFPQLIERWDLSAYDLVVSSHHCVAKGVMTRADQLHVSYVHSPMRYAWDLTHEYLGGRGPTRWLRRQAAWPLLHRLRTWDVISANRVDHFIANSRTVADRIWRCWRREAAVVHPPVDTAFFTPGSGSRGDYWLHAGRLVSYKRADLAIQAFSLLPQERLLVAGDGPELARLRRHAPANVSFAGRPDGERLRELLRGARGLVFCAEEDFGILPVEAMACGTPVVAYGRGGVTESVIHGKTGWLFPERTPAGLAQAVGEAGRQTWDVAAIRLHAEGFASERFRQALRAEVDAAMAMGRGRR